MCPSSARFRLADVEKAAGAVVALAAADDLAEHSGVVFARTGRPIRPTGHAANPDLARRLWDASADLTAEGGLR